MRATIDPGTTYRLMVQTKDGRDALFIPVDGVLFGPIPVTPELWFGQTLERWHRAIAEGDGAALLTIDHASGAVSYRLVTIIGLWLDRLGDLLQTQSAVAAMFQAAAAPHPDQSGKA